MRKLYGLIGYPLTHSFSKKYFTAKFQKEGLTDHQYELFAIKSINKLSKTIQEHSNLKGLNVTIPYKEVVIPFLDKLDESAKIVGAVNVISIEDGRLTGYNSDFYGFKQSLLKWLPLDYKEIEALVLGTGGASKAVIAVLNSLNIQFKLVSRTKSDNAISYEDLNSSSVITDSKLIINTTPLGMAPNIEASPDIPYHQISKSHYIYDLIYNPEETIFLKKCAAQDAKTKNGLEMLELQAEKSWEIWTS
ncbi:MAG: shikimate dehydrogenase [Bacteroidetes bacterium]|nr:MAG: shikimate dehydrogenase [Bacteroidota bacterium]